MHEVGPYDCRRVRTRNGPAAADTAAAAGPLGRAQASSGVSFSEMLLMQ